jgi:two-component system OmpR family response regulator
MATTSRLFPIYSAHIRARVVILTARDAVSDKIEGLDARADDHLAKPFDVDELMARVRARMRRGGEAATEPPVAIGALSCHSRAREVVVDGRPLSLRRRELLLLESLAGRAPPREILLAEVYDGGLEPRSKALDALVSRLRKHLNDEQAGVSIVPIRGVGYILAKTAS